MTAEEQSRAGGRQPWSDVTLKTVSRDDAALSIGRAILDRLERDSGYPLDFGVLGKLLEHAGIYVSGIGRQETPPSRGSD